jgi:toxin ParE1/3/4
MEFIISPSARVDLLELWEYASRRSEERANELLSSFREAFNLLIEYPEMGRWREGTPEGILSLSHKGYLVFYRLFVEHVEIVRVLHGSRDYADIFKNA